MSTTSSNVPAADHGPALHVVLLAGVVRGPVVERTASDGASLVSFDLAVRDLSGRSLVPVTMREADVALADGDPVALRGHVRKRFHRAGGATVARTSVEAVELIDASRPAAVRRLAERALVDATSTLSTNRKRRPA
jgi:hypothetical protein